MGLSLLLVYVTLVLDDCLCWSLVLAYGSFIVSVGIFQITLGDLLGLVDS